MFKIVRSKTYRSSKTYEKARNMVDESLNIAYKNIFSKLRPGRLRNTFGGTFSCSSGDKIKILALVDTEEQIVRHISAEI